MPDSDTKRGRADLIDHAQAVEWYLADGDDELDREARQAARAHIEGCARCQEKLAAENAMKVKIPSLAAVHAPNELRQRILLALDEEDRVTQLRARRLSRSVRWLSAGAVAACLLAVLVFHFHTYGNSNPAFDTAIASYEKAEQAFTPNIPSRSPDELAVAFIEKFGVPMAWDFGSLQLHSAGGRIERGVDGAPVGYSLYKGPRGSMLCVIHRDDEFQFPAGGQVVKGIHIYQYKGYSVAATNRYAVFVIMVSNMPADDLAQAFAQLPG